MKNDNMDKIYVWNNYSSKYILDNIYYGHIIK